MKIHLATIILLASASLSCEKIKNLTDKARSAVEANLASDAGEGGTVADPELQKLVDHTTEGYIFRKDLPFPKQLEVRVTMKQELSARLVRSSEIETRTETVKGTQTNVTRFVRTADTVQYTLEESTFAEPVVEGTPETEQPVVKQLVISPKPRTFKRARGVWKSDDSEGFRAAVLSKDLSPVFSDLLESNALSPRPLWFAKKRLKIGDKLPIAESSLSMVFAGKAKGSLSLALESIEAVHGHPCGVFSVTGSISRKQFPDFEGNLTDEEINIQSGKIWLSLIHPLVLKEELDTIQSTRTGTRGNPASRGQGSIKVSTVREWKNMEP